MESYKLAKRIAELALDKKGFDVKIIDISHLELSFDYFVVVSGTIDQHVKAMFNHIRKELSKEGEKPINYEGDNNYKWALIDYVDVVVHIFDQENREFYKIEEVWESAKIEEIKEG